MIDWILPENKKVLLQQDIRLTQNINVMRYNSCIEVRKNRFSIWTLSEKPIFWTKNFFSNKCEKLSYESPLEINRNKHFKLRSTPDSSSKFTTKFFIKSDLDLDKKESRVDSKNLFRLSSMSIVKQISKITSFRVSYYTNIFSCVMISMSLLNHIHILDHVYLSW